MDDRNSVLSIILLSYYSSNRINTVFKQIFDLLDSQHILFELIIVDDGSKDDSFAIATTLENRYTNVKAYQLSKNYTSHYSIFAGLSVCQGACAIVITDDEQQPYSVIVDCYRLWEKNNKIIIPYRKSRGDSFFDKIWAISFYKIMNALSDITLPPLGADTFFIDREVINIINERISPINTTSITEVLRLGFDPYYLPYTRSKSLTQSRWTFKKKWRLANDFFFSSSTFPIKFITFLGLFFSSFAGLITLVYIYAKLFGNQNFWKLNVIPGWTSIIIFITFFSGLILFSLGIIASYIWRIYEEVKNRPGYLIKNKNQ